MSRRIARLALAEAALLCRTIGHAWEPFIPNEREMTPRGAWDLSLECVRCTTQRFDPIDKKYNVGNRSYKYPDGYKDTASRGADGRIDKSILRKELRSFLTHR